MLIKEIKKDLIPCSCIEKLTIVKLPILPKWIYKFHAFPIKIPASLCNTDKLILKYIYGKEKDLKWLKQF